MIPVAKALGQKPRRLKKKGSKMNATEQKVGDENAIVQSPETVNAVKKKGGEEQAIALTEVAHAVSDGMDLPGLIAAAQANMGTPNEVELAEYGAALRAVVAEVEFHVSKTDSFTVERYYHTGCLINAVAQRLRDKKKLNDWLKGQTTRNAQVESFRQMRKIASMGAGVLDYAVLGKNRVLELYYMVKELEEYGGGVNAESVARRLKELEGQNPFPRHAAMGQSDVDECRVHMDALVTRYRLETAFELRDVCAFDDARTIAAAKKKAMERGKAASVAELFSGETDRAACLKQWVGNGMKMARALAEGDPARLGERLAKVKPEVDEIIGNPHKVAALRQNESFRGTVEEAYNSITALRAQLRGDNTTTEEDAQ